MASLTEYKLCVCVTVSEFSCACMPAPHAAGNLRKTHDPESSTRKVRHHPVELSAPPFISIKTCNNACTLG